MLKSNKDEIFAKAALEKLSSPEQLDVLMQVTSPVGWIALLATGALLFVTVVWGVFGTIPIKVDGQGILIRGGSVLDIEAGSTGRVTEILIKPGDTVKVGQKIAVIGQGGQVAKIENLQASLKALETQDSTQSQAERENVKSALTALAKERASRTGSTKDLEEQVRALEQKVANQEELLRRGLVTQTGVLTSKNALFAAQEKAAQNTIRLTQITTEEGTLRKQLQTGTQSRVERIEEMRRELKLLQAQLEGSSQVTSPYAGRVLERMVERGNLVTPDMRIVTLELLDSPLEAVIFIPPGDGKKVEPGMQVRISPSTVRREEFGFMVGKVATVSGFPATPDGMLRVLRNPSLVEQLSGGSAPLEVTAVLDVDQATRSGFRWSSPKGPPVGIFGGTLCDASIVVSQRRPIGYVIPLVKETLGLQ